MSPTIPLIDSMTVTCTNGHITNCFMLMSNKQYVSLRLSNASMDTMFIRQAYYDHMDRLLKSGDYVRFRYSDPQSQWVTTEVVRKSQP